MSYNEESTRLWGNPLISAETREKYGNGDCTHGTLLVNQTYQLTIYESNGYEIRLFELFCLVLALRVNIKTIMYHNFDKINLWLRHPHIRCMKQENGMPIL